MIKFCTIVKPDFAHVASLLEQSYEVGKLSNFGPLYDLLVYNLKTYLHLPEDKDIVLVSSGHTALMAAYSCLDTTVALLPAYTFESTRVAATIQDIKVILSDVNYKTGCIDLDLIKKSLKDNPYIDTVVVVTALSNIPNLKEIDSYCKIHDISLIIDGAASFGTPDIYEYGDIFCLSFHATKTYGIGEGGAIICSKKIAEKVKRFINFGFDSDRNPVCMGMNAKVSEYTCAIGLDILDKMRDVCFKRHSNIVKYEKELKDLSLHSYSPFTIYQTYPIFLANSAQATRLRDRFKDNLIETLQYYKPLNKIESLFPVTNSLYHRNICLPVHQNISENELEMIIQLVKSCL